jgi:DNA repair protein RecO (recombination protein O)
MASEKTRAIVLRVVPFSESSCVLTLFTEDFGKRSALAKGAWRPKGPFEGALDLLALVRIVFLPKSSEALDLLTEARLERRFRAAQRDLARLYGGYYVAELLLELTEPGDVHRELFAVADQTLQALDQDAPVAPTLLAFELAALRHLGHAPLLDRCAACDRPLRVPAGEGGRVALGLLAGGVLCPDCRPGRRAVVSLTVPAWRWLAQLAGTGPPPLGDAATPDQAPAEVCGELRAVMNQYLAHLVGHRLRMSAYLSPTPRGR